MKNPVRRYTLDENDSVGTLVRSGRILVVERAHRVDDAVFVNESVSVRTSGTPNFHDVKRSHGGAPLLADVGDLAVELRRPDGELEAHAFITGEAGGYYDLSPLPTHMRDARAYRMEPEPCVDPLFSLMHQFMLVKYEGDLGLMDVFGKSEAEAVNTANSLSQLWCQAPAQESNPYYKIAGTPMGALVGRIKVGDKPRLFFAIDNHVDSGVAGSFQLGLLWEHATELPAVRRMTPEELEFFRRADR